LAAALSCCCALLAAGSAHASLLGSDTQQFAVLGQFSNNQTNFNNGAIVGDVGMGSPRAFTISNCTLTGNIRFSTTVNTSGISGGGIPGPGPYTVSGGGTVSGGISANDAVVTSAITYSNDLGQFLAGESGTAISVTTGGSLNAGSGAVFTGQSVDGNPLGTYRFFSVGSVNFPNGVFTITGSATDQVVLNVPSSANFHGSIVLAGGLTSDNVIINMAGGDYATHMGGPALDINTNGADTTGTWLDPNGAMSLVHSTLDGRFFGGDTQNQQIVSGAFINAPVPAPATLALLAGSMLAGGVRRRRRA
jgi:hypothetical protein